ncbi:MAG: chemotaxis protein CheW [Gammaproteobacteria bacterium]
MQTATPEAPELSIQAIGEQYLTFVLGKEEYAIEILKVQEIKSWGPVTPIPCAPEYLLGVINLRGAIVPVIDLRRRFGLDTGEFTPTTVVIIVRAKCGEQEHVAGLVVDQVAEVYHLDPTSIQDSVEIAGSIDANFIRGLAQADKKLIILVNLDQIIESSLDLLDMAREEANA